MPTPSILSPKLATAGLDFTGACHCGTVRFKVHLEKGLEYASRCTCSLCRMRGAIAVSARLDEMEIVQGADNLTLYQFNTRTAKHYFCKTCGIYTHHQRRSDPTKFGINIACLEGVSPFDYQSVPVFDGINHPNDAPDQKVDDRMGWLKYVPVEDR